MDNIKEEPLPAGGSCLLGSINLSEFVKNPFTNKASVDLEALAESVNTAVLALNKVLMEGLPMHPLDEQRQSVNDWRQIGLGTMGLGDMLIKMGKKYGSKESLDIINKVYRVIAASAIFTSNELAKEEGTFPKCTKEMREAIIRSDFVQHLGLTEFGKKDILEYGLANSQLLTCAPTGSIGTMLQTSTGIEPNFAFSYNRRTISLNKEETTYKVDSRIVQEYKKATGATELPDYFVCAGDIDYHDRIAVQSTLQQYIDASISSTVNLPNETTVEQVADLYMEAWKKGLKGITIWRDGCQRQGILTTEKKEDKPKEKGYAGNAAKTVNTPVIKASDNLIGRKRTLQTGCGSLHLTAFFDPETGRLRETYFSKGSTGGCAQFMVGLSRLVSLAARANISIEEIIDQLKSSGTCPSYAVRKATKSDTSIGSSCPVAIGNALLDMYTEIQRELFYNNSSSIQGDHKVIGMPKCPRCGEPIQMVEGCMTCSSCGYSKCS